MLLTRWYKILKRLFGRAFFVILSILLQILWFVFFIILLGYRYPFFAGAVRALSIIAVFVIVNKRVNPAYKLAWTLLIMSTPLVGFAIYLMFGRSRMAKKTRIHFAQFAENGNLLMDEDEEVREALLEEDPHIERQSRYLRDCGSFPVYTHTKTRYFAEGEQLYECMVSELSKARYFIFMEFFIIDRGEMWSTILDILERKAREGLDVRLIYDDAGCVNTLPAKFYKEIRARGIRCEVFNPFRPLVSVVMNNRDHRKIAVIDGHVGFTGGINIADEYINKKKRFGHWKDTGVMIKGDAVWNFTVMFLQMWSAITGITDDLSEDATALYRPDCYLEKPYDNDGYVQPYSDSPLDEETVGENVYLNMISQAKRYVYIFTPYLIVDNEMMTALCLAAKSGVDIRIVTPGIPDKKQIYLLSRSYYGQLIDAGVRIFEYRPGFIHAKCFVCDDEAAVVGSINLDYRSLYLHFECGVWMYRCSAVMQVKKDVLDTISASEEIKREFLEKQNKFVTFWQNVLRLLAPML